MNYFFLAEFPCALKIDGKFYQILDQNYHKISLQNQCLVEICPLGVGTPITFLLDQNPPCPPPQNLTFTTCKNALLVSVTPPLTDEFKVIAQENFSNAQVTVFYDNGYKLSIQTQKDFYIEQLDFKVDCVQIRAVFNNDALAICYNQTPCHLAVYTFLDGIRKVIGESATTVTFSPLCSVKNYCDMANHQITKTYRMENSNIITDKQTISLDPLQPSDLPTELIPFAFAEEFLTGGEIDQFLSQSVIDNKFKLKNYLGDFVGVCPAPPDFDSVGLIYKKDKNLYQVKRLSCDIYQNKITNLYLE